MTPLTRVGKRLDNITRYILDSNPQDKWVLSNIVPMFLEAIKSSTTIQEEQIISTFGIREILDLMPIREGKRRITVKIATGFERPDTRKIKIEGHLKRS